MKPDDWTRAEVLFHELVELEPSARHARLAEISASDPSLGAEIEELLAAHDTPGVLEQLAEEFSQRFAAEPGERTTPSAGLKGAKVGHYAVEDMIGRGGMGEVYRARDTRLDRLVALKFLPAWLSRDPAARERFFVEAKTVSSIQHTNVCGLHDIGETEDGRMYLVMPFYEGETLKSRLSRGSLPPDEVVAMGLEAARGLAAAHERGIVHRDIKPGNLLLTEEGPLKILDFGVAKLADVDLTRTGQTPGTMSYMSPEQRAGRPIDASSDLWSLGAVLHEAVTGLRPVDGRPGPAFEASAPAGLRAVVTRLLAPDPADRYPDARALAEDLAVLADGSDALRAAPAPEAIRFLAELKRRRVFQVAALYGVVGFGIIEVADAAFPHVGLPPWAPTLIVWLVLLGFPVALVLAWAFETTPDGGIRRTRSVRPAILDAIAAQPVRRRWPIGLAGAAGGALLVAGAWLALGDRVERLIPGGLVKPQATAGDGVAILPFHLVNITADSGAWHEGIARQLGEAVEPLPGLRKVDPATVMHAYEDRFAEQAPDSASALGLARSLGARYAILGETLGAGPNVEATAKIYDLERGVLRGTAHARAPADSFFSLTDRLRLAILQDTLLPADSSALANISRAQTTSFPAFKLYLQGEQAYRRGQYEEAAQHFVDAVEVDSTFARAMYRAARAGEWMADANLMAEYGRRLQRFVAGASERDSLLYVSVAGVGQDVIPTLERLTTRYPDDLDGWMALGDAYYHYGGRALRPAAAYRAAWDRSHALGGEYVEGVVHLVQDAFARRDSADARRWIQRLDDLSPCELLQFVYPAMWGDEQERRAAVEGFRAYWESRTLSCFWDVSMVTPELARAYEGRILDGLLAGKGPPHVAAWIQRWRMRHGRLAETRTLLTQLLDVARFDRWAARTLLSLHLSDFPDSATARLAADHLRAIVRGGSDEAPRPWRADDEFWLGALAVDERRWADVEVTARITDAAADSIRRSATGESGDSARALAQAAREAADIATVLRLWAEFERREDSDLGALEAVIARLPTYTTGQIVNPELQEFLRYRIGKRLFERGELDRAAMYFSSLNPAEENHYVPARFYLGRIYEEQGEIEQAREHYRIFVEWWDGADDELQPFVDEGRAGLARVSGQVE